MDHLDNNRPHGGWQRLADALETMARRDGAAVSIDSSGTTLEASRRGGDESIDGAIAAARELSREICRACGAPGRPRKREDGSAAAARCERCAGELPARPEVEWSPDEVETREKRGYGDETWSRLALCSLGVERAADLMNRRYRPDDERGDILHRRTSGWNHLLRALLRIGFEERKRHPHLEIVDLKEKWASLSMIITGGTQRHAGIAQLMSWFSRTVCEQCGEPGEMHDGREHAEAVYIACGRCEAKRLAERRRRHDR